MWQFVFRLVITGKSQCEIEVSNYFIKFTYAAAILRYLVINYSVYVNKYTTIQVITAISELKREKCCVLCTVF